jgi:patatin-like phospholipase/acyl hydrolase
MFGKVNIREALTEEVFIVSFEYNTQQPRVFSKFAQKIDPTNYDVTFTDAAEASSAAPVYFDPKILGD